MAKEISKKSIAYWRARSEYLQERLLNKGESFSQDVAKQFDAAIVGIEKEISAFYGRFAENNQITYADAQRILTTSERNAYRMDVKEYIEKGRTLNYTQEWAHALENASTVHRVTRLQALQTQMRQQVETAYGSYSKGMADTAKDIFTEGYYRNIYEVQRGYGQGNSFTQLDTVKIEQVIAKPWTPDNKTFSDKIWQDKDKLLHNLNTKLTQAFIRGDDVRKLAKDLANTCGVSKANAMRLIQTEAAFFSAATKLESYKALGVKQYQIVATLDTRTSNICQGMDGKVFDIGQYEPGITANPFHPWCRSTTAPYFEDETGTRVARGEDGKTYPVPGDIAYKEWKAKYVDFTHFTPTEIRAGLLSQNEDSAKYRDVTEYVPLKLTPFKSYEMDVDLSRDTKANLVNATNACSKKGYEDLNDTREYVSILSVETGSPEYEKFWLMKGMHAHVHLSDEASEYLKRAKPNSLIVTHNHNNTSELSEGDLRKVFFKYPSVKIITAAADGQLFYLEKVDGAVYDIDEILDGLKDLPKTAESLLKQYNIKLLSEEQYTDFKFALLTDYYKKKNLVFRRW